MKPLILHGHERSITQVKYNREGDLVFSSSKDTMPNVWWSVNGERLGTFDGHFGAVWCIDVDWKTENFVSGAADNTIRMWACETGQQKSQIECKSAIRSCAFSYSANMLAFSTDKAMRNPCELYVVDARTTGAESLNDPVMNVRIETGPKITSMFWGALDELIVTGHDNGDIAQWDLRTGKKINLVSEHSGAINDLQMNADGSMFVTASKDCTAKLFDTASLELLKTYQTERPVNSAVISPLRDHIMLGGGQDAMEVTTTSSRQGKFEARLFHLVFEEEFGRVKGHFGPINSLQFHPDGRSFVSGGEDGYVRLQEFDPMYFEFQYDY